MVFIEELYLSPGITNMRKSIDGLALIVSEILDLDPFSESLFVFCNWERNKLKNSPLADQWLLTVLPPSGKRPLQVAEWTVIARRELNWLLDGLSIEQKKAHR